VDVPHAVDRGRELGAVPSVGHLLTRETPEQRRTAIT
jgi:hypothetical protein